MTGIRDTVFEPIPEHQQIYDRLYRLYRRLHDAFGVKEDRDDLYDVMKTLLDIRDEVKAGRPAGTERGGASDDAERVAS